MFVHNKTIIYIGFLSLQLIIVITFFFTQELRMMYVLVQSHKKSNVIKFRIYILFHEVRNFTQIEFRTLISLTICNISIRKHP